LIVPDLEITPIKSKIYSYEISNVIIDIIVDFAAMFLSGLHSQQFKLAQEHQQDRGYQ